MLMRPELAKKTKYVPYEILVLLRRNLVDVAKNVGKIEGKNIAANCAEVGSRILNSTWEMIPAPVEGCTASVGDSSLKTIASYEKNFCGRSGSFWWYLDSFAKL